MDTSWLDKLKQYVERKSVVILIFSSAEWDSLRQSRRGLNEFTIARSHGIMRSATPSTPCLVLREKHVGDDMYFGLISTRSTVTTLDSRIKIKRGVAIQPSSRAALFHLLSDRRHSSSLRKRLNSDDPVIKLPSKLSSYLIERLASITSNQGGMRAVTESLFSPKYFKDMVSFQEDAVRTALKAFGLSANDQSVSLELVKGQDTALARIPITEDSVIEHDARHIPGYDLVKSDLTGRAVFEKGNDRLEVFTANRRSLERVFGVDLVYFNVIRQNVVMLQYKMLEPMRSEDKEVDWIYRPDAKLDDEIRRMRRFSVYHAPGRYEYRLNPSVYYLKFVKRDGSIGSGGIITPIDHFEKLREDPTCRGPRQGLRVSYESLSGRYLRQSAFVELIRSGYIGAHAETTGHIRTLVEATLNNGRALVAAIQQHGEAKTIAPD